MDQLSEEPPLLSILEVFATSAAPDAQSEVSAVKVAKALTVEEETAADWAFGWETENRQAPNKEERGKVTLKATLINQLAKLEARAAAEQ